MRWVTAQEIERASELGGLVAELHSAYVGADRVEVPTRSLILREQPFAAFVAMPAHSERHRLFITKVGAVVPQASSDRRSVHALVTAFSTEDGRPLAVLDGAAITNLKCAAVTALVTDLCTAKDARVLAVLGTGVQAREQIRGVGLVRRLVQIRVWSRDPGHVEDFVRRARALAPEAEFVSCASASAAIEGADIVSTATTSTEPLGSSAWFGRSGLHVNCMGAHTPHSRELPLDLLQTSTLIVEDVEMAVAEAGEVHRRATPLAVLVGQDVIALRQTRTVFSSTGHALLDLIATAHVLGRMGLTR